MKILKCPECKRVKPFSEEIVMGICPGCQVEMEVVDE